MLKCLITAYNVYNTIVHIYLTIYNELFSYFLIKTKSWFKPWFLLKKKVGLNPV